MSDVRLDAVLNAAVDAIITINVDGTIEQANPAAARLFDYEADAFVGRNVSFLMPEPWSSRHDGFLRHHQRTGENRIIGIGREVEGKRRDGSTFPMHLAVSEFEVDGAVHYTGIIHDLSARKRAENALMHAQKMESIGQLTGGIAHDFNNLLTVITGNLELLDMQLESEGQRELLREAQEAAEMGANLTHRLLSFARRSLLEPQVVDVNAKVEELGAMLKRAMGGNVTLALDLADDLWDARVDPGQLESVILNLAVNARDAMPAGGRVIVETVNAVLDEGYSAVEIGVLAGEYVRITVADQGTGMDDETLSRAFEPFFTTKGKGKGTGLGLSMVYGFARQSGGTATIYSEVGLGTSVTVYLPRDIAGMKAETTARGPRTMPMGRSETVLIVEDDPRVRRLTEQRLQTLGYVTLVAEDGPSALEIFRQQGEIDLVFTDLAMPGGMTGLDLARLIVAERAELPVVLTSGYAEELVTAEASAPAFPMLRKPYRQEDLARAVRDGLDGRQQTTGVQSSKVN